MRILVVDDHAVVRRGVKQVLDEAFEGAVVCEAGSGADALRQVRQERWDAVVLDITMPDRNGLEVLREIKALEPKLPVLMLTVHPEEQFAVLSLKLGASGYVAKESATEELAAAVEKVTAGRKYVSPALSERLASLLEAEPRNARLDGLSHREFEVLCGLGSGKTVGQVADALCLSVKTVSTHRARLLRKLGLKTNAELMLYAVRHGLVR